MVKNSSKLKVLIVEDSKTTAETIRAYLEKIDISQVLMADTGEIAIELFKKHRPDIILLDVLLPDFDGFAVARQIRTLEQDEDWSAIIFLTSQSGDQYLAQGIEAGGDDYLIKPVSEVVLNSKIRAMRRLVEMQRTLVGMTHQMNIANRELQRLSTTDGLTGIANRRFFDELLLREWRRCMRMKVSIALVMIDVDHFKLYNDTYGHMAGDICLKTVATEAASTLTRASDVVARYGGEEFALILGETDLKGAQFVANQVRQRISNLNMPHAPSEFDHVTISCGVVSTVPNSKLSLDIFLQSSDHALYLAKEQGRNCVVSGEYGRVT